jgi:hypothetical protein
MSMKSTASAVVLASAVATAFVGFRRAADEGGSRCGDRGALYIIGWTGSRRTICQYGNELRIDAAIFDRSGDRDRIALPVRFLA